MSRATFIANCHRFTLDSIDTVHLLHYRTLKILDVQNPNTRENPEVGYQDFAQIVIRPSIMDQVSLAGGASTRLVVKCMLLEFSGCAICLRIEVCHRTSIGYGHYELLQYQQIRMWKLTVCIAAEGFLASLQSMQHELLILDLQFPRQAERPLFQLYAGTTLPLPPTPACLQTPTICG